VISHNLKRTCLELCDFNFASTGDPSRELQPLTACPVLNVAGINLMFTALWSSSKAKRSGSKNPVCPSSGLNSTDLDGST